MRVRSGFPCQEASGSALRPDTTNNVVTTGSPARASRMPASIRQEDSARGRFARERHTAARRMGVKACPRCLAEHPTHCHPERSEGSASMRHVRAALGMTGSLSRALPMSASAWTCA